MLSTLFSPLYIFFIGVLVAGYGGWSVYSADNFLEKSTVETAAIVDSGTNHHGEGPISRLAVYKLVVEFSDDSGETHRAIIDRGHDEQDLDIGDSLDIRYDPDHPDGAISSDELLEKKKTSGMVYVALGLLICAFGFMRMGGGTEEEIL